MRNMEGFDQEANDQYRARRRRGHVNTPSPWSFAPQGSAQQIPPSKAEIATLKAWENNTGTGPVIDSWKNGKSCTRIMADPKVERFLADGRKVENGYCAAVGPLHGDENRGERTDKATPHRTVSSLSWNDLVQHGMMEDRG